MKRRRRKLKEWDENEEKKRRMNGWESGEFWMFRKLGEKEIKKGKNARVQLRDCCK